MQLPEHSNTDQMILQPSDEGINKDTSPDNDSSGDNEAQKYVRQIKQRFNDKLAGKKDGEESVSSI